MNRGWPCAAHELKTRFISSLGYVERIQKTPLSESIQEDLQELGAVLHRGVRICLDTAAATQLMNGTKSLAVVVALPLLLP